MELPGIYDVILLHCYIIVCQYLLIFPSISIYIKHWNLFTFTFHEMFNEINSVTGISLFLYNCWFIIIAGLVTAHNLLTMNCNENKYIYHTLDSSVYDIIEQGIMMNNTISSPLFHPLYYSLYMFFLRSIYTLFERGIFTNK
jgi:hypothetical protein